MMNPMRRDAAVQLARLESSMRACGDDVSTSRPRWLCQIVPVALVAALALLTGLVPTAGMAQAQAPVPGPGPGQEDAAVARGKSSAIREEPRSGTRSASNPASIEVSGQPPDRIAEEVADRNRSAAISAPADRLQLDTSVVTGNRELPKVLYIVPWKKAGLGEPPGRPFNSLLDEVLAPVDRDVFRREVTYYGVVSGSADSAARREAAATR